MDTSEGPKIQRGHQGNAAVKPKRGEDRWGDRKSIGEPNVTVIALVGRS